MIEIVTKDAELARIARLIFTFSATDADLASIKSEDLFAIKSDTSEPRYLMAPIERATKPDPNSRIRKYVASTESPDRGGDIVRVKGWDFTEFKRNPVALWCHQSRDLPIGNVIDIKKDKLPDGTPCLYESIEYVDEKTYPFAQQVLSMVDQGVVRGVSVGFVPTDVYLPGSPEERDAMGLGRYGVEYRKQKQIELSNCPIPMNQDALATKAIEDLARTGKITADVATLALARIQSGRKTLFAIGWPEQKQVETPAPVEAKPEVVAPVVAGDERLIKTLEVLTKTVEALAKAMEQTAALNARVEALEAQNKVQPAKPAAAPESRVKNAEAFFAEAVSTLAGRLNVSKS